MKSTLQDWEDIFSHVYLYTFYQARTEGEFVNLRQYVDDSLGIKSHRDSISSYLKKGAKVKVQVGFTPKDDSLKTSLLIVR